MADGQRRGEVRRDRALALIVGLALLVLGGTAHALTLPVTVEGERVVVRAEAGLAAHAERAAARADAYLAEIESDLEGLRRVERVEVRLVKHVEDLAAAAPAGMGAPPWAVGVAYPEQGVVAIALRGRQGELLEADRTLAHELAHMALGRALGDGHVPRWLTEGFAYLHSSDFSWDRSTTLLGAAIGGKLWRIRELEHRFPAAEDAAALAYAESYDFVEFLARRGRWIDKRNVGDRAPFRAFLRHLAAGKTLDDAAFEAFSTPLDTLEKEWRDDLKSRYLWYPIGLGTGLLWLLGSLLLVFAWLRKRRQMRRLMDEMDDEVPGQGVT